MKLSGALAVCSAFALTAGAAGQMQPPHRLPQASQWQLQNYPFDNPKLPAEKRIDDLLSLE